MFLLTLFIAILVAGVYYVRKGPKESENIPYVSGLPLALAYLQKKDAEEVQDILYNVSKDYDLYVTHFGVVKEYVFAKPEYIRILLMESEDIAIKNTLPESAISKFFGTGLPLSNGEEWRTFKRLTTPAFNHSSYSDIVGEAMMNLFTFMKPNLDRPVDILEIMQRTIIEVLGNFAFGHQFGCLESEELPHLVQSYKYIMSMASSFIRLVVPLVDSLPTKSNRKLFECLKEFDEFIYDIIEKKKKEVDENKVPNDGRFNLLTSVLELSKEEGIPIRTKQLRDEMASLFVAGTDTTIMALCTSLYYIARYPEVQEKARAEAISILGNEPVYPDPEQVKELKYLSAVVKESLRIHPPVPEITFRKLTNPIKVGPYIVPKDAICLINAWQIQNDPRYWVNPKQFDPERFLRGDKVQHFTWVPFAAGPRRCAGQNLSFAGQKVIIAMLLLKYKWSLPEDSIHKNKFMLTQEFVVKPRDLKLIFTERV